MAPKKCETCGESYWTHCTNGRCPDGRPNVSDEELEPSGGATCPECGTKNVGLIEARDGTRHCGCYCAKSIDLPGPDDPPIPPNATMTFGVGAPQLSVMLTPNAHAMLQRLTDTGLFGHNMAATAEQLINAMLRELQQKGW